MDISQELPMALATASSPGAMPAGLLTQMQQLAQQQTALMNKTLQVRVLYDDFSTWTTSVSGSSTINKSDASDRYDDSAYGGTATTSALMTTDGMSSLAGGATSCYMESPAITLDLTDGFIVAAIKATDWSTFKDGGGIQLRLYSSGTDYTSYTLDDTTTAGTCINYVDSNGKWVLVPLTFARPAVVGGNGVTRSAVTKIRFRPIDKWLSGAAVSPAQLRVGMIGVARELYAQYPNGLITVCFDDGRITNRSMAFPILESFGIRGTMFIVHDHIGQDNSFLTKADIDWLVARGWDACPHAYSLAVHESGYPAKIAADGLAAATADLQAARDYHAAVGWNVRHFAYPHGYFDGQTIEMVRGLGFRTARTTIGSDSNPRLDTYPPTDPLKVSATSLSQTRTLANFKAWVDIVKANRLWGVLNVHLLTAGAPANASEWNRDDFRSLILYATQQGVAFRSLGQLLP